jgi:4-amino-4-deoxy-L-arabinose transferase-like glycosyltransferase
LIIDTWVNHLINLVFIFLFWISVFGWGSLFLKKQENKLEINLFRIGFGAAVVIAFTLIIGFAGYLYPLPIIVFLTIGLAMGLNLISKNWQEISLNYIHGFNLKEKVFLIALIYPFSVALIGALSPETFYDSTVYHLGVPQAWINSHKIYPLNRMLMSFYPFNVQMLYTIGLMLRDEMAAKLIHLSFGVFNFVIVFVMLNKYFSRSVAWLGSVIFFTTPFVPVIAAKTAIEMGIAFFEVLAFFAFMNWINNKEKKWLIISAVFSGLGMGSKYISLYAAASLVFTLIFIRLIRDKASIKDVIKETAIFVAIASLVVSPWLIRNYIWAKNPIFPFLWEKMGNIKLTSLEYFSDPPRRPFTIKNILMLPWDFATNAKIQEAYCGPVYLIFLPLLFLFKRKNRQIDPFIVYSLIYYFIWQYTQAYFRMLVPALTVISGVFAYFIWNVPSSFIKKTAVWIVVIMALGNIQLASTLQKYSENPLGVSLGLVSRAEHLSKGKGVGSYVSPDYNAINWINENLPKDSYVLLLGDIRGLYLKRRFLTHSVSDYPPIVEIVRNSKNEDEVYEKLKNLGITHVMLNAREAFRLKSYSIYSWKADEWQRFSLFWNKYVNELYNADWVFVYELKQFKADDIPHKIPHNFLAEIYLAKR